MMTTPYIKCVFLFCSVATNLYILSVRFSILFFLLSIMIQLHTKSKVIGRLHRQSVIALHHLISQINECLLASIDVAR
jgi:hypothetical protein